MAVIEGLPALMAGLKAMEGLDKTLVKAWRPIARDEQRSAQQFAIGYGGMQAHFAPLIQGRASTKGISLGLRSSVGNPAFWGAKPRHRSGWNANRAFLGGHPQFKPWVGNSWQVGGPGGPYGLNDAVRFDLPHILDRVDAAVREVTRLAFPEGAP